MFFQNLQKLFLGVTIVGTLLLIYLWYEDYSFTNNPLESKYQQQVNLKHAKLKILAYKNFNIKRNFPVIISNNMSSSKFGMTTFDTKGRIEIYLNKKRFKENDKYMIDDVLPHEYAHAIMFAIGDFTNENSGHSKKWQNICLKLEGARCDRFVNHQDILIEKTNPFK